MTSVQVDGTKQVTPHMQIAMLHRMLPDRIVVNLNGRNTGGVDATYVGDHLKPAIFQQADIVCHLRVTTAKLFKLSHGGTMTNMFVAVAEFFAK